MKCPNQEKLFELVSIPAEMPRLARLRMQWHTNRCADCQQQMSAIRSTWEGYFTPEPDITSSLMRVYSRLQSDETLILKGWKLSEFRPVRASSVPSTAWAWRTGMAVAAAILVVIVGLTGRLPGMGPAHEETMTAAVTASEKLPFAQIRVEDKDNNRIQVHYLQPELLQSVEFETTSAR